MLRICKNPEWIDRTAWGLQQRDKALGGMKYSDDVLKRQPYVAGDKFSMAGITVLAGPMFADAAAIAIPQDCTALSAWRSRVADLPSVRTRSGQMFEPEDLRRLGF